MISRLDGFEIFDYQNNIFQIKFKQSSTALINSLLKTRLINGYADDTYTSITLKAHSVKTLSRYQEDYEEQHGKPHLLVSDSAKAIRSLTKQLNHLITSENHTILGYSPEYIIVINDQTFAFLCSELVAPLIPESNSAMICCPFSPLDFYFSPEIQKITEIPVFIHYKTAYFSFACLIIYLLLGNNDFYTEYIDKKQSSQLIYALDNHPVKNTKIYWLLSRCLVEDHNNRTILLI